MSFPIGSAGTLVEGLFDRKCAVIEAQYVRHHNVEKFIADGWSVLQICGPHAAYSVIAYRTVENTHGQEMQGEG